MTESRLMVRLCSILVLLCATVAVVSAGQSASSAFARQEDRSVRLNSYNNWGFKNREGWNQEQMLTVLARKDNIVITETWPEGIEARLKELNPQCRVYAYYSLMTKPRWDTDVASAGRRASRLSPLSMSEIEANGWWLRDGNGQIVKEKESSWFLDAGKPGFKESYLKNMLQRLACRKADGVVLDYWCIGIRGSYLGSFMKGRPMPAAYPTDEDWFNKAWKPFVKHVCSGLRSAGYRVVGNAAGEYGTTNAKQQWQRSQLDGTIYEQFAVGGPGNKDNWLRGTVIEKRLNAFRSDPLEAWAADYGLRKTDKEYERKQLLALAMYYLAIPASQKNRSYNHYGGGVISWSPLWDFNIGVPVADIEKTPGKFSWKRKFSRGVVLMNYESEFKCEFTLDGKFADSKNRTYRGKVILQPHSALILAKQD